MPGYECRPKAAHQEELRLPAVARTERTGSPN